MNYFAHGFRFVTRPWFRAGTAVPDWLGTADRRTRIRKRPAQSLADNGEGPLAELAAGVLLHLEDDRRFHGNPAFLEISAELTERLRGVLGRGTRHRLGFVGHIATEMLLDSVLIEDEPSLLDRYYRALGSVDPGRIEAAVNRMAQGSTQRLAPFVRRFLAVEFLRDYQNSSTLLARLNQVMGRIGLPQIPRDAEQVLSSSRSPVRLRKAELLG